MYILPTIMAILKILKIELGPYLKKIDSNLKQNLVKLKKLMKNKTKQKKHHV